MSIKAQDIFKINPGLIPRDTALITKVYENNLPYLNIDLYYRGLAPSSYDSILIDLGTDKNLFNAMQIKGVVTNSNFDLGTLGMFPYSSNGTRDTISGDVYDYWNVKLKIPISNDLNAQVATLRMGDKYHFNNFYFFNRKYFFFDVKTSIDTTEFNQIKIVKTSDKWLITNPNKLSLVINLFDLNGKLLKTILMNESLYNLQISGLTLIVIENENIKKLVY